ncbi:hypothetical protein [Nocardia crassostreae]|uniref:hypothetical protein n=1 Tax=Nocardia crassostreae TaxID=53428 RepID=UPI0008296252|nr:hypothetical protein [Nocardia crassostreae]
MSVLFFIVPSAIMAGVLLIPYSVIAQAIRSRRDEAGRRLVWTTGRTAAGRCVRVFTKTHGGSGNSRVWTTLHHVYEYTPGTGRAVRFEESGGSSTIVEGDAVAVRYLDIDDTLIATTREPGPARPAATAAAVAFSLIFAALAWAICLGGMLSYAQWH